MRDAVNSWERENHLSKTFHLSACDWIWAMSSPPLACSSLDFLYAISKQHLEGGREGAQLEPAFLSSLCARLCDCHKANQIQISPLLKSHTSLPPAQSSQSCLPRSKVPCQIRSVARSPAISPAHEVRIIQLNSAFFAFQSLSPHQSTNIQHTHSDL